jgi:anionic cell wall polymer biosynthesis LytR-Cps2A-Psr (LCP) family protein
MLDGIDVYVPYTIDDPTYPDMSFGYDPLYITEGLHHFDGTMALKYARTRHQDNDFYRAQRQQQVIFAIRRKVMGLGFLDLVNQAPALYKRISSSMFTDLSTEELVQIAHVVNGIREENIHTTVLNYDYVRSHWTDTGSHVLLLKHNEATRLVQEMFGNNP